jgi:hypothetical protein
VSGFVPGGLSGSIKSNRSCATFISFSFIASGN